MQDLKITLVQSEVVWEDIPANLAAFDTRPDTIREETDLIIAAGLQAFISRLDGQGSGN